jgi:hypothetical protein
MSFFGGPGNNYTSHGIASAVLRLRERGGLAYVSGNGGYLALAQDLRPAATARAPVSSTRIAPGRDGSQPAGDPRRGRRVRQEHRHLQPRQPGQAAPSSRPSPTAAASGRANGRSCRACRPLPRPARPSVPAPIPHMQTSGSASIPSQVRARPPRSAIAARPGGRLHAIRPQVAPC